jgi:cytochrome P450
MPSNLPPGPSTPGPLLTVRWQRRTTELLEESRERFGHVWTLSLVGGTTFVQVSDPELVEDVLTADPEVLYGEARLATPLVGERSVLVLQAEDHTAMRKLMQAPFRSDHVQRYRDTIREICERELVNWPLNEPLPLLPRLQTITLNSIMSTIFGVTGGERQAMLRGRVHAVLEWGGNPWRMAQHQFKYMRGWGPPKSFLKVLEPVDKQVFEEIERARNDPRLEERDDVLSMLLRARFEDGRPLTDRELRDQLVTLLIQGHGSTANGLAWALERLMRHPESHARLRKEAQTDSEEYLDAVVKETLRLRPPLPFVMRMVHRPFRLGDYELEPGTMVACNLYILQRREDLFPEPDRFRPERFLDGEPPRYAWIPFGGGGGRGCIGAGFALAEMKVVLRTILQRVRLAPAEQADERIKRLGVGFTPSEGARAVVLERLSSAGAVHAA